MDEIQFFASLVEGKKNRKNVQRNVNLLRSNYEVMRIFGDCNG